MPWPKGRTRGPMSERHRDKMSKAMIEAWKDLDSRENWHQSRLVEFIISNVTSKNKALPGS
jgi:hypothetical protein